MCRNQKSCGLFTSQLHSSSWRGVPHSERSPACSLDSLLTFFPAPFALGFPHVLCSLSLFNLLLHYSLGNLIGLTAVSEEKLSQPGGLSVRIYLYMPVGILIHKCQMHQKFNYKKQRPALLAIKAECPSVASSVFLSPFLFTQIRTMCLHSCGTSQARCPSYPGLRARLAPVFAFSSTSEQRQL